MKNLVFWNILFVQSAPNLINIFISIYDDNPLALLEAIIDNGLQENNTIKSKQVVKLTMEFIAHPYETIVDSIGSDCCVVVNNNSTGRHGLVFQLNGPKRVELMSRFSQKRKESK